MNEGIDELISAAELGDEAKRFLESDLGRCILGMAQQQVALAQEALEKISPVETEAIRALQNKAALGRQFEQWLVELLHEGEQSMRIFKQQQQEG